MEWPKQEIVLTARWRGGWVCEEQKLGWTEGREAVSMGASTIIQAKNGGDFIQRK